MLQECLMRHYAAKKKRTPRNTYCAYCPAVLGKLGKSTESVGIIKILRQIHPSFIRLEDLAQKLSACQQNVNKWLLSFVESGIVKQELVWTEGARYRVFRLELPDDE